MRLFTLFFTVFLSSAAWGLYDTEVLATPEDSWTHCSELATGCRNSTLPKSILQSFQLASRSCEAEQQSLNCQALAAKDPELKTKIRNCSAQALCEESQRQVGLMLKGCFWNAPGALGSDIWNSIRDGVEKSKLCLKDPKCTSSIGQGLGFLNPPLLLWRVNSSLMSADMDKARELLPHIYDGGKAWVQQKGVELQCFNRQSQMELICYGALNVFAPGAALKVGERIPKIVGLLKLGKYEKSEQVAVEALEQGKRAPNAIKGKPESLKISSKAEFIDHNLNLEFTTVEQNKKWIQLAENTTPDGKTKFFEVENSVMKTLNDTTQDKNFVTALTNKQKEILKSKIDEFAGSHPEIEILPYSDFKAMRFAIRPKPPSNSLPTSIEKEFAQIFKNANSEFAQSMIANNLVQASDRPAEWFRAGFGETADQATLASRYSRNIAGENQLRNFSDSSLHENLQTTLQATEMFRKDLQRDFQKSNLMESVPGTGKMTLKKEVFEAVRKASSPSELQETLEKSLGTKVSESQARKIRDYSELIDEFSPGIQIAKREVASLSDSVNGGLSIDFSGLGAQNLKATASALVKSEKIDQAVIQARISEKSVTESLTAKKEAVKTSIQKILKRDGIESEVIASGDDLVVKPKKPIPPETRKEIAEELSKNIDPSAIRASHVPEGVTNPSDRMMIGTHGETIEKLTRKNLQGEIPKEKLDQVLLMVDMNSKASGQGSAQLIFGTGRTSLNDLEKQKIKRAFDKAIEDMNQKLQKDKFVGNYKSAG